ncbi:peptide chain release factor N(5)-glutamine methyltransferase [Spiroplasma sp. AdecLV25b]|uniref:peptide chain release factor N(5)-glutamine methyltransferase n=1 Tax=Spiroplasma sp. AdecLV25b TaxID=3027162 RepID=UPI0027E0542D|nr:peptide chain release factor N(5)-glutamine methyltransferase [Spiroplasma sp. AdecLV25b]
MTYKDYLLAAKHINHNDEKVNKIILLYFIEKDLSWLYANMDAEIENTFLEQYLLLIEKYITGYPLQYIIRYEYFYGNKFFVDNRVLIPRSETEELVNYVFDYAKNIFHDDKLSILDLGTGSGAIAISIALAKPQWKVVASDISIAALEVAKINCKNYNLNNIRFIESDLFSNLKNHKFNIIISNPPYIDETSDTYLMSNLQYEPKSALFAEENGLLLYKLIFQRCSEFVTKPFLLAFEFGFDQKKALEILVKKYLYNYHYQFVKDINGKWRMLFVWQ